MLLGRPTLFGAALVVPKPRRFVRIVRIERMLQRAILAIWALRSDLLRIMSRICSYCETAGFGACQVQLCMARGKYVEYIRWQIRTGTAPRPDKRSVQRNFFEAEGRKPISVVTVAMQFRKQFHENDDAFCECDGARRECASLERKCGAMWSLADVKRPGVCACERHHLGL